MKDDPITGIGQMLLFAGMSHGTAYAIVKGIDYLAGLNDDDLKEMSKNISPDYAVRLRAVVKAAKKAPEKVTVETT